MFVKQPLLPVSANGIVSLSMKPDMLCTATTLLNNGFKGQHPKPPPSARFPKSYSDDFSNYTIDKLARGFSDVYGSFAVRPTTSSSSGGGGGSSVSNRVPQMALTQVATAKPTGWAPTNLDPLTFIGDSMWIDVSVSVTAMVNGSSKSTAVTSARSTDPPPPPHQPPYVRVCSGGCGDTSKRGLSYGCNDGCCFRISEAGNWSLGGGESKTTGVVKGFTDTWHKIE